VKSAVYRGQLQYTDWRKSCVAGDRKALTEQSFTGEKRVDYRMFWYWAQSGGLRVAVREVPAMREALQMHGGNGCTCP
jgi:hypothetical protein